METRTNIFLIKSCNSAILQSYYQDPESSTEYRVPGTEDPRKRARGGEGVRAGQDSRFQRLARPARLARLARPARPTFASSFISFRRTKKASVGKACMTCPSPFALRLSPFAFISYVTSLLLIPVTCGLSNRWFFPFSWT